MTAEAESRQPRPPPLSRLSATRVISGEQAEAYRQAASSLGLKLNSSTFVIDRAGVCPELEQAMRAEPGAVPDGTAVWIILDEDQSRLAHRHERFSFESQALERLFDQGASLIRSVTSREPLIALLTIEPGVASTLEELSMMESFKVEFRTPSGSLVKILQLLDLDAGLENSDNHLSRDYIQSMVDLAADCGGSKAGLMSVRLPSLSGPVRSLCAPILGSVYWLPGEGQDLLLHPPPYGKPDLSETYQGLAQIVKLSSPRLARRLEEMGLVRFDGSLVPRRLQEIEDEALLAAGIDPFSLSLPDRSPAIASRRSSLPRAWHELTAVAALMRRKIPLQSEQLDGLSEESRVKLAQPLKEEDLIGRLLSDLDHIDYPRFYRYNRNRFFEHFADYAELKKKYVWQRIRQAATETGQARDEDDSGDGGKEDDPVHIVEGPDEEDEIRFL